MLFLFTCREYILYAISINFTDIRERRQVGQQGNFIREPGRPMRRGCQRRRCQRCRSPSKTNMGATARRAAGVDLREKN